MSIFIDRSLSPLESISEYLREVQGLSFHEIAVLMGRDDRTIWTCYSRAKKKRTN
ncbi:sigma factor-like helix-turn-helix DNA-binding protein [Nanoarchaeota archaeon]